METDTWIVGIAALYHDASAALIYNGKVIAAGQEERFTKVKHDPSLPIRSVKWLLESNNLTIDDISYFVFYEKPLLKFERILATSVTYFPKSWRLFPLQMKAWLGDKIWLKKKLIDTFGVPESKWLFCSHHLSHAASAFYCSPFTSAVILTLDGVGEWATTALWRGKGNHIEQIAEIRYPHSLGLLYSAVTAHLGFVVNNGEYKVMGMASYGEPVHANAFRNMIIFKDDGSFALDLKYFCHHLHPKKATTQAFEEVLGPPREPGTEFDLKHSDEKIRQESKRCADIAASVQLVLEETVIKLWKSSNELLNDTSVDAEKNIVMAGGVALNAVCNMKLCETGIFDDVWVQPAAGDAGNSIGCALWAWYQVLGNDRTDKEISFFQPYLGKAWSSTSIEEFCQDLHTKFTYHEKREVFIQRVVDVLTEGCIIGWMQEKFEWGPRALGNRSILADPSKPDQGEKINKSVKFREKYRPFAPIVLDKYFDEWFEFPQAGRHLLQYMLATVRVKEEQKSKIPSVVHVDGTARAQILSREVNPLLYDIIEQFYQKTGIPMLINTSFNLKGDPMVNSPVDAIATFLQSGLDYLYMDQFEVARPKRERIFGVPRELGGIS